MKFVNHINYANKDGEVYCCLRNKVIMLDDQQTNEYCLKCKMFGGKLPGNGVNCRWNDVRDVTEPHVVYDPVGEFTSNQIRQVKPSLNWPAVATESTESIEAIPSC